MIKKEKLGWIGIGLLLLVLGYLVLAAPKTRATFDPKVNICHCPDGNPNNCQTQNLPVVATISHLQNHQYDYPGVCQAVPTATPSATPTASPSSSPSATPTGSPSATPSASPTVEPSSTPQASEAPQELRVYYSIPEAPVCGATNTTQIGGNFHIYRKGDSAIAKWIPTEGNKVNIFYKQNTAPNWQYSLLGVANDGYEVINGLGKLDITFALQQVNGGCSGGPLTQAVVDGPTKGWVLFR